MFGDKMAHERCEQCGFDGASYSDAQLLDALRALGPEWRKLLASAGPQLRVRPAPEVWSAIEYAAHSRDITALHAFGVEQALSVDEPVYPEFAEGTVDEVASGYGAEDPTLVVDALDAAARQLAGAAAAAGPAAWS